MKVLITGTSSGIGKACALHFLSKGHSVCGLDKEKSTIDNKAYTHFVCDLSDEKTLPQIDGVEVLFCNAGLQNSNDDIKNNLYSAIYTTQKYAFQPFIKSVLFNASASARSGFEFPLYTASKAGVVGYMKNTAIHLANEYKAVCNSISLGGVLTSSNNPVMNDKKLWGKIMDVTPLKKWMSLEEVADWVYFLTVTNKSATGQDFLIDNGELNLNCTFVWSKNV